MSGEDGGRDLPEREREGATQEPLILVVMGVSGSGKTTIAILLATALGFQFQEGDDLHPAANIAKMANGIPLTDTDRLPWLHRIAGVIDGWRGSGESGVLTCSALRERYRDIIIGGRPDVTLVYLKGSYEVIRRRMIARHGHFMPPDLLGSQFADLEEPAPGPRTVVVDVAGTPSDIVTEILRQLGRGAAHG